MAKRKMEFDLINVNWGKNNPARKVGKILIIGESPENSPYLAFEVGDKTYWMEDEETELFAVNILKALKSKKLK